MVIRNKILRSVFFPAKNKALARKISIVTPQAFRESIRKLKRGGITLEEKRALTLAQTRAKLQLRRINLSPNERKEFRAISKMKIPNISKRRIK